MAIKDMFASQSQVSRCGGRLLTLNNLWESGDTEGNKEVESVFNMGGVHFWLMGAGLNNLLHQHIFCMYPCL